MRFNFKRAPVGIPKRFMVEVAWPWLPGNAREMALTVLRSHVKSVRAGSRGQTFAEMAEDLGTTCDIARDAWIRGCARLVGAVRREINRQSAMEAQVAAELSRRQFRADHALWVQLGKPLSRYAGMWRRAL